MDSNQTATECAAAHEKQSVARVWRAGQTRDATWRRFVTAGTIEEILSERHEAS